MRRLRWPLLIAVGGILLILGLLLQQSTSTTEAPPQPAVGGVYTEALIGRIQRLNPILDLFNQTDRDIDRLIYSGLVRFDSRGMPQKDLASEWAISADATLYTITLREDALWHDGEPVTSDDIIYTFSKLQDEDFPGPEDLRDFWKAVNIVRLDERSVQFQLPEPFAPFLDYLAVGLLPDHLLRGVSAGELVDHPFNLAPVGTGPFRFDRFILEDESIRGVSLSAFEGYYGRRPFMERVEFYLFPDSSEALDAYQDGTVLGIGTIDNQILTEVLAMPQMNLHTARLPRMGIIFLNLKHPVKEFLADKQIRKALMQALNREHIIHLAFDGQGIVPTGPIMPGTWAFAESLQQHPFDPEEAARILDDEEWTLPAGALPGDPAYLRTKDEQFLSLELAYADTPAFTQVAEAVAFYWEQIGIKVDLRPVDPAAMLNEILEPREFEAALTELVFSPYPDPDPYPFWHDSQTETGQNYSGFEDRNISIWLEQARTTPDYGRRADLYASFQYRFQDQLPALPLYYPTYSFGIDAQVQGVTVGPMIDPADRFNRIEEWFLIAQRAPAAQPTPASGAN